MELGEGRGHPTAQCSAAIGKTNLVLGIICREMNCKLNLSEVNGVPLQILTLPT